MTERRRDEDRDRIHMSAPSVCAFLPGKSTSRSKQARGERD